MSASIRSAIRLVLATAACWFGDLPNSFGQARPSITTQPLSQSVVVGGNVSFSVVASGQTPLDYQWYFNGNAVTNSARISGSTTAKLSISGVQTNDAGGYSVAVGNRHGLAGSSTATLTVLVPVSMTTQPTNRTVISGSNTTFAVTVEGTLPINFQWYRNGAPLTSGGRFAGTKTAALTISNVSTNDAGTFFVQASNSFSSASSSNALLDVTPPPPGVPFIAAFNPTSGAVGQTVTISGGNFSPIPSSNTVWFGAVAATVIGASETELTVLVPTNASHAAISVEVNRFVAEARAPFVVTYVGSGDFSSSSFTNFALPSGNAPIGVKIADIDGDGKSDILFANYTDNTISIYRNISSQGALTPGSFAPAVSFAVGLQPRQISIGDIDGDGIRDVVVANTGGATLSIFRNASIPGVISLAPRVDFSTGANPHQPALVDLNGDGKFDIAVGTMSGSALSILRNTATNGIITTNSFAPKVNFPASAQSGFVTAGDIDGDGKPDLVVCNDSAGSISIFRNTTLKGNSNITFDPRVDFITSARPYGGSAIGDLDGDGKADIAVATYSGGTISVFRNVSTIGAVTSNSLEQRIDFVTGGSTHAVAIVDIDGDGKSDLAASSEYANTVSVFRNLSTNGTLTVNSFAPRVDFPTAWNPGGFAVGDLDSDGRPDIVAAATYGNMLTILRNVNSPEPKIITQPVAQTSFVGSNVTLSVVATGVAPLGYQWLKGGVDVSGATDSTLTFAAISESDGGDYAVVVSNSFGAITSSVARVAAFAPADYLVNLDFGSGPESVGSPKSGSAATGKPTDFWNFYSRDDAAGNWRTDGTVTNLQLGNGIVTPASARVQNAPGAWSNGALDSMYNNYIYPFNGGNVTVTLSDIPAGEYDLYLYSHNGNFQVTSGATTFPIRTSYDVPTANPQIWQEGKQYALFRSIQVTGNQPTVVTVRPSATDVAIIAGLQLAAVVPTPPTIVVQPTNRIVAAGTNASFAVAATGTAPLSYQWFFKDASLTDAGNISGATSNILSIASAQTNDAGEYFVVITNSVGSITSAVATLDIGYPPTITSAPISQTNLLGSNVAFSVAAGGTAPFNYQWRFNGTNLSDNARISGATNSNLTISNLAAGDAGNYDVLVINPVGSVTSLVATLTIVQPPTFTTQPVGRSVVPTLPTTFNALAMSSYPISYQWHLNGTNISGATNTSYEIAAVGASDLGFYQLVASNELGVATSAVAELTFGSVVAWGRNSSGESLPPPGLSNVFAVSGSFGSSTAVRTDGSVVAWGSGPGTNLPTGLTNVVALSSAGGTVALRADGSITGWNFGTVSVIQVPPLTNIIAVAAGFSHGLALRSDGQVLSWGNPPLSSVPADLVGVRKIACGVNHSLALRADGTVVAWGSGAGTNVPPGLRDVVAIAGGYNHSLALLNDGTVVAWGTGSGTNLPKGLTNIVAISAGGYPQGQAVNLAIRSNGTVVAWGDNGFGETNTPSVLSNLVSVAVAGAPYHSLAIVGDGKPLIVEQPIGGTSWTGREFKMSATAVGFTNLITGGNVPLKFQWQFNGVDIPGATNSSITLANLTTNNAGSYQLIVSNALGVALSIPAPLKILSNVPPTLLSQPPTAQTNYLGNVASLGVSVAGSGPLTYQWRMSSGIDRPLTNILGATNATLVFDPVLMSHTSNYSVLVTSPFGSVSTRGTLLRVQAIRVWGYQPIEPPSTLSNVVSVAVGQSHYLALRSDGKISGWGTGFSGETNPPASLTNSIVTAIAAGNQHSLALRSDGIPFAWGYPSFGVTNVPASAKNVIAISAGRDHDLALRSDGTVVAWGSNSSGQTNVPVSATNVVGIAAGGVHSLALRSNGTIVGWGNNTYGQTTPPINATNIIAIAVGGEHSLALKSDGTVIAWGRNFSGSTNVPVGLSNVVAISASGGHNTALRSDGSIVTWGNYLYYNTSGSITGQGDFGSIIQIADGGDRSICLFGTRAPVITIQPFSRVVFQGSNTVLVAKAAAAQPASYQWVFNGANISGATNDTLVLTSLQFAQSGAYQLVVSNQYGITASKPAKVVVSIPLGVAVDFEKGATWTSTGVSSWFGQTNITHDHIDAARSGDIDHGQETILQTSLQTGPQQISFWWKVSSETGFDKLEFLVNGVVQAAISGEVDWQQRIIQIPSGMPLLQWRYSKDGSGTIGQDAGWVDQIALVPNPPVITIQPASKTVNMGTNVTFSVGVSGTGPFGFKWRKNETNIVGLNSSSLILNNVGRAQRGVYSVIVTNAGGSVTSSNAILDVLVPQQLSVSIATNGAFQLLSTDVDGGLLSESDVANLELQTSADLTNWTGLPNGLTLSNGTLFLNDPEQTNFPTRFYRIVEH